MHALGYETGHTAYRPRTPVHHCTRTRRDRLLGQRGTGHKEPRGFEHAFLDTQHLAVGAISTFTSSHDRQAEPRRVTVSRESIAPTHHLDKTMFDPLSTSVNHSA